MPNSRKVLIVTGDDFGISPSVNAAIIQAHREGILTSASLMVNGRAFQEAVNLAKAHPRLGVGLHISLVRGKATLSPLEVPNLVNRAGSFPENPVAAGFKYFFSPRTKSQLAKEIEAQIQKFLASGLVPSHLDGHLHLHVHPAILLILLPLAQKYAIPAFRLPRENFRLNLKLDHSNFWLKSVHSLIYHCLCVHAARQLKRCGLAFPDRFFGLLACGHLQESYVLGVIDKLEPGVTEIGMHPAVNLPPELEKWAPDYQYQEELKALTSGAVKESIQARGIQLTNYHYLSQAGAIGTLG